MNKHFLLITLLVLTFGALALPAAAQGGGSDVVKSVRAAYVAAKEKMKLANGEQSPRNDATATLHYNVPATGPCTTVAHCYFDLDTDEDGAHYYPYFITLKYNVAARDFYEEYLYDPVSGRLLFAFIQHDTFEGPKNEERYYYDGSGKLASVNVKGERSVDDAVLLSQAEKYRRVIPQFLDFGY